MWKVLLIVTNPQRVIANTAVPVSYMEVFYSCCVAPGEKKKSMNVGLSEITESI